MIKSIRFILTVFLLANYTAGSAQELLNNQRKQLFDYNWKFLLGDPELARQANFNDKGWRKLDLPHDWSIEGKIDSKNPMGNDGGYFPAGVAWYRKSFTVPAALKGKLLSICFEGVYMNAEVFINGKSIGKRPYGYSAFNYDLTPYLNFNKENTIAVRVDNSQQKNSRWYSGSGIYRHVWIKVTEPIHIDDWGTIIKSSEIAVGKALVQVKTKLRNESKQPQDFVLSTKITDNKKALAGSNTLKVRLAANEVKELSQDIRIGNTKLWSPETPALYSAHVSLQKGSKKLDENKTSFGIRSLAFSTQNGFQLNGKKVILNGGCLHHDNGFLGAAAYDRAEIRKVELLKSAGFNAVRTSHNPPSEMFLHACDSLGLLVMDEAFDGWRTSKTKYDYSLYFDEWWQRDIEAMVLRDRNHPSIFMWSIGNEIIERKEARAVETAKMLAGHIHKLDATRPVTSAMTTWDKEWEIFDPLFAAHDVGGYNYQLHRAASDHERVPSRIIVQTESYPREAFANWKLVQDHSYILGDFVWTAMDYLGESSIGRYYYPGEPGGQHWEKDFYPWHGAYCGDIDLTGWRKPISHYRDMLYNESKKLYLAVKEPNPAAGDIKETMWSVWPTWESWNWPGYEGKDLQVEIYSRYPKVRLYLNDKLIGEQPTTQLQEFKATFGVSYTAGVLKAVGVEGDVEKETRILRTAGETSQIKLIADRRTIDANGQDLAYVLVELSDAKGTLQPNAENELSFKVNGPGAIAAVGNANLKDTDPYVGNTRKAWKGRAMVVIKSTRQSGKIELIVSAKGLADSKVLVSSVK